MFNNCTFCRNIYKIFIYVTKQWNYFPPPPILKIVKKSLGKYANPGFNHIYFLYFTSTTHFIITVVIIVGKCVNFRVMFKKGCIIMEGGEYSTYYIRNWYISRFLIHNVFKNFKSNLMLAVRIIKRYSKLIKLQFWGGCIILSWNRY